MSLRTHCHPSCFPQLPERQWTRNACKRDSANAFTDEKTQKESGKHMKPQLCSELTRPLPFWYVSDTGGGVLCIWWMRRKSTRDTTSHRRASLSIFSKTFSASRPHLRRLKCLRDPAILISVTARDEDVQTYLFSRLQRDGYLSQDVKIKTVETIGQSAQGM